jgi:excisionase family DNA binding protein
MENMLYTVKQVAEILQTNTDYVHKLRKAGVLKFMKLGQLKCRKETLEEFLRKYDGREDDPFNLKEGEANVDRQSIG